MIHEIKIQSKYYKKVLTGEKTFEIRFNDRNYAVGDILKLREIENNMYTGETIDVRIMYMLKHADFPEGIPDGYVVFSIEKLGGLNNAR